MSTRRSPILFLFLCTILLNEHTEQSRHKSIIKKKEGKKMRKTDRLVRVKKVKWKKSKMKKRPHVRRLL